MQRCALFKVSRSDVQSMDLSEVIKGAWLVTLRRHVQAVQTVLVVGIDTGTFINQHLAHLYVPVERCEVQSCELLITCHQIHPSPHYVLLVLRVYLLNSIFGRLQ